MDGEYGTTNYAGLTKFLGPGFNYFTREALVDFKTAVGADDLVLPETDVDERAPAAQEQPAGSQAPPEVAPRVVAGPPVEPAPALPDDVVRRPSAARSRRRPNHPYEAQIETSYPEAYRSPEAVMPFRDGHDVESRGGYYLSSERPPRCQLGTDMMLKVGVDTI